MHVWIIFLWRITYLFITKKNCHWFIFFYYTKPNWLVIICSHNVSSRMRMAWMTNNVEWANDDVILTYFFHWFLFLSLINLLLTFPLRDVVELSYGMNDIISFWMWRWWYWATFYVDIWKVRKYYFSFNWISLFSF